MKKNMVNIEQKRAGQRLSKIGSKIAAATELAQKAKQLASSSESLLIAAQQEIENLYVSLDQEE